MSHITVIGDPAVFKCFLDGPVTWTYHFQQVSSESLLHDGRIALIRSVRIDNSGFYYCKYKNISRKGVIYAIGKQKGY